MSALERKGNGIFTQSMDVVIVLMATALLLLVPLIAMQFSGDVVWSWFDFAVAGVLIAGTGMLLVLAARKIRNTTRLAIAGVAITAAFLFAWAQLAVGIFGD